MQPGTLPATPRTDLIKVAYRPSGHAVCCVGTDNEDHSLRPLGRLSRSDSLMGGGRGGLVGPVIRSDALLSTCCTWLAAGVTAPTNICGRFLDATALVAAAAAAGPGRPLLPDADVAALLPGSCRSGPWPLVPGFMLADLVGSAMVGRGGGCWGLKGSCGVPLADSLLLPICALTALSKGILLAAALPSVPLIRLGKKRRAPSGVTIRGCAPGNGMETSG